ncbi:MAG: hypothetical protein PHD67_09245 [Oscillospiraceae bacterium]|nr:hypothetical protein [Oscillospiraceae bacterium]
MANFDKHQSRDSRGRWIKGSALHRAFHRFHKFTARHVFRGDSTAPAVAPQGNAASDKGKAKANPYTLELERLKRKYPELATQIERQTAELEQVEKQRAALIAAIRDEIKRLADWIEPDETGKFPRSIIKHIRRELDRYERVLQTADPDTPRRRTWEARIPAYGVIIRGDAEQLAAFIQLLGAAGVL